MQKGYFDNAATTLIKPDGMYSFLSHYMCEYGVNVSRSNTASFNSAGSIINETRKLLLSLVHASANKEVVFLPSATIALNTVINGLSIKNNDNVYISHFEHNAVTRTLTHRRKEIGFNIEYFNMPESELKYELSLIEKQFIEKKPNVVIISQVSNVTGLIAPINELSGLAKKYGATVVIDGAQGCGLIETTVSHSIDYYVFAGHKSLMSPFGVGGFICDKNSILPAFIYGGTGIDSANEEMPKSIPERFEAGSINIMAIAGLNYSLKWIMEQSEFIKNKEKTNLKRLHDLLDKYDYIKIIEVSGEKTSIISCKFKGLTSDEAGRVLAERGITVRTGLQCAPFAHKFLKSFPEGLVRFSISCLTNDDDFMALEEALNYMGEEL